MKEKIENALIALGFIVFVIVLMGGIHKMACYGEQSGTMVVVGGNSVRCR